MAVIADDEHAVVSESVRMFIKHAPQTMTLYSDNLVPALEMVFQDDSARDEFYKRLVDAMGA